MTCKTCLHWRPDADSRLKSDPEGECRRFPPSVYPMFDNTDGSVRTVTLATFTYASYGCGEFVPRRSGMKV